MNRSDQPSPTRAPQPAASGRDRCRPGSVVMAILAVAAVAPHATWGQDRAVVEAPGRGPIVPADIDHLLLHAEGAVIGIRRGNIVQIEVENAADEASPAEREKDQQPDQPRLSDSHPDIFKKLVDHRVNQQIRIFTHQARQLITLWRANHGLSADQARVLTEAATASISALEEELKTDFGSFLDLVFTPVNMAHHGQGADEVLQLVLESLETDEENFFFYRPPATLRLEQQDDWIDAVRQGLPDEDAFAAWRRQIEAVERTEQEAESNFLSQAIEQAEEDAGQIMGDQLNRLFELMPFDDDAQVQLRESGGKLVAAAVESWTEDLRYFVHRTDPDIWEFLTETVPGPTSGDAWGQALAENLDDHQREAWAMVLQESDDEEMRLFEARMEATAANYENHFRNSISGSVEEVQLLLELDGQQEEQFREASEQAVQEAVEEWKERAREWVKGLQGEAREQALRRGSISVGIDQEMALRQPAWTGAFEKILSEEQQQEWTLRQQMFEDQRQLITSRLILLTVDQGIGLTPDQWQLMEALISEADLSSIIQRFRQPHFHLNPYEIGRTLRGLDSAEVRKILTDSQWQRWQEYVAIIENPHGTRRSIALDEVEDDASVDDDLALETLISLFIHQRSAHERERVMMELMAEIDFIRMTSDLPDGIIRRLETAAKGAAEEIIDEWSDNFIRTVRERLKRVQRQIWKTQIASLAGVQFGNRDATESRIWQNLIEQLEAADQAEARVTALKAREQLHSEAVADLITLHAASRLGISPEQWPVLNQAIIAALLKYGPDFEAALGRSNTKWYLRNPGIIMPVAAIPEDQLREILSERQYQRWRDEVGTSTTGFWSRVESLHRQRVKDE